MAFSFNGFRNSWINDRGGGGTDFGNDFNAWVGQTYYIGTNFTPHTFPGSNLGLTANFTDGSGNYVRPNPFIP